MVKARQIAQFHRHGHMRGLRHYQISEFRAPGLRHVRNDVPESAPRKPGSVNKPGPGREGPAPTPVRPQNSRVTGETEQDQSHFPHRVHHARRGPQRRLFWFQKYTLAKFPRDSAQRAHSPETRA
ncbi:hypothetical protein SKAU_G00314060 [Synaphobranchus kaupii]|uniref:Uncharacterized protein n=1 Tax=Synaphobranchus kaupii TaxID=118154 RepID=A0A9Q1ESC6_SYNKA|nr:hypothetical protein SKAU_G00314060 [Synaphobranchus kaupii]